MKFKQHLSSSKANLYEVVANSGQRLLIECGCTWKQLQKKLKYDLSNIAGCLISHEHKDHCKCYKELLNAGITAHSSEGTWSGIGVDRIWSWAILKPSTRYYFGEFQVFPFDTIHDADEPLGFIIHADNENLLFATDTKYIKQRFSIPFNIIAIECSFNGDILQDMMDRNAIEPMVAKRLLHSHQEERACYDYLSQCCDLSVCREIHLLHMSGDNIDKKKVTERFKNLFIKVVTV